MTDWPTVGWVWSPALFGEACLIFPGAESLTNWALPAIYSSGSSSLQPQPPQLRLPKETALEMHRNNLAEHQQRFRELAPFRQQKLDSLIWLEDPCRLSFQHMKDHPDHLHHIKRPRYFGYTSATATKRDASRRAILAEGSKNEQAILRHKEFRSSVIKQLSYLNAMAESKDQAIFLERRNGI